MVIKRKQTLATWRNLAHMTQKEFADEVGVDRATVSAWENGVCEPSFELLARLCEIFEETFDGILL